MFSIRFSKNKFIVCSIAIVIGLLTATGCRAAEGENWTQHTIKDRQGFERVLDAYRIRLPQSWKLSARIAWRKPCTGHPLFETLFRATSSSSRVGMRRASSHSYTWSEYEYGPQFTADMIAFMRRSAEQTRAEIREKMKGSNCYLDQVENGRQLVDNIVLSVRSRTTRLVSIKPDRERSDFLEKRAEAIEVPNATMKVGAMIVRLEYPTRVGEIEEEVLLAWTTSIMDNRNPGDGGMKMVSTTVEPLISYWAPIGKLDTLRPVFEKISKSFSAESEWANRVKKKINAYYREQREENRKQQAERKQEFDEHMRRQKRRAAERERDNDRFINSVIRGGQAFPPTFPDMMSFGQVQIGR